MRSTATTAAIHEFGVFNVVCTFLRRLILVFTRTRQTLKLHHIRSVYICEPVRDCIMDEASETGAGFA